jgi:hypothetical protein
MTTKMLIYSYAQTLTCIICYDSIVFVLNPKTKARKGLILYNKLNIATATKKHVDENHCNFAKRFEEEIHFPLKKM